MTSIIAILAALGSVVWGAAKFMRWYNLPEVAQARADARKKAQEERTKRLEERQKTKREKQKRKHGGQ